MEDRKNKMNRHKIWKKIKESFMKNENKISRNEGNEEMKKEGSKLKLKFKGEKKKNMAKGNPSNKNMEIKVHKGERKGEKRRERKK